MWYSYSVHVRMTSVGFTGSETMMTSRHEKLSAFTGPLWRESLRWRHNGRDSVSNHQPHDCSLNRLFRRRSKKTSKLRVLVFVRGIHRGPGNSPHKGPVTRKMFPFGDVIMRVLNPLWPSDSICWHNSGSTFVQVVALCLTAPSHYLN